MAISTTRRAVHPQPIKTPRVKRELPVPVPAASDQLADALSAESAGSATVGAGQLSEQQKYELMWSREQYRIVSPGEGIAHHFLYVAKPRAGATVIDFGCGTGRGGLMIALFGERLKVEMVDFAANCLDEDVAAACQTQSHALAFTQADLSKPLPIAGEYGFCTDVMEHIPPEQVNRVLTHILQAAQHVFFQISCRDDDCGQLIGETLHLSVHDAAWWQKKFTDIECQIHYFKDLGDSCIVYVTAWASGKDIVDVGELNIELERVRANVRANCEAGWQQVHPFEPNADEVMIIGGGPSLAEQLEEIKRLRASGAKLVTLNGAYNWALEQGLKVSATVVVDARAFNARFTHPVQDDTLYLIGSQCDPEVLEGLPRDRTWMWNTTAESIQDILEEVCGPGKWFGVVGGCTVLLRAIPLLRMLGYQKFHLFGCDSCVTEDGRHHSYAQPENYGAPTFNAIIGGRRFTCTAWHIAQAQEFMDLVRIMGHEFEIEVHGEGLLAWILQHGYDIDVEAEKRAESAVI
jgi:SAM-dependent methyltransferase